MSIELTEACNLRCDYCYRESDSSKRAHMPVGTLFDVLERLWRAGLRSVELTGGEPMLHKDFGAILDFCSAMFAMVGVLSNGTLVTDQLDAKFASLGERSMLSISLDASTAAAHDARRGVPGSFVRTTSAIRRLSAAGVGIRVSTVVDERNFADLENTLLLARDLGARAFSYTPLLPLGRGKDQFSGAWTLSATQVMMTESGLAERYRGFLGVLSADAVCEIEGEDGCGAGYRTFAMDPWGNVRPCATFGAGELVFGNLLSQSLEEVFSHPAVFAMNRLRAPSPQFCSGCKRESFCRYCHLRGMHASHTENGCAWLKQEPFEPILAAWRPPS